MTQFYRNPKSMPCSIGLSKWIHFQWIPLHVDIEDNKIADTLAKAGACDPLIFAPLNLFGDLFQGKVQKQNHLVYSTQHGWYETNCPGGSPIRGRNRQDKTTLTHFLSGLRRSWTHTDDAKIYEVCTKRTTGLASPKHILECLRLSRWDLTANPLLVLDFLRSKSTKFGHQPIIINKV
ncbi:transposable element Tc3 transposase [Trichonephila clavipes]|nr:transposable element Tc3 transposase [Trichonephila clavipes]